MTRRRKSPLFCPALAALLGASCAASLTILPIPALVSLLAAGIAKGGRWGRRLIFFAAGALSATLLWISPLRHGPMPSPLSPVTVEAVVERARLDSHGSWTLRLQVARIRQQARPFFRPRVLYLSLPGDDPPPSPGARIHARGYVLAPRLYANDPLVTGRSHRLRIKSRRLLSIRSEPGWMSRAVEGMRRRILPGSHHQPQALGRGLALARSLLLGERDALPPEVRDALGRLGLGHLLAVSGLHVGLILALVYRFSLSLSRRPRLALCLMAMVLYALLVGARPSLVRAAVMGALLLTALWRERVPNPANALATVILVTVFSAPDWLGELGFQLTLAATAGILFFSPVFIARWPWLPRWLAQGFAATLSAQLCTLPWTLSSFHRLSFSAPVLNLVAIPITAAFLALATVWSGLFFVCPSLGRLALPLLDALAWPFFASVSLPAASILSLPLTMGQGQAVLLVLITLALARIRWPILWILPFFIMLCLVVCRGPDGRVEIVAFDVGQGDSLLVRDGNEAVLVDGGGWQGHGIGARVLLPALAGQGVRSLHAVVLSHPERDHCQGLQEIVRELPVQEVWLTRQAAPTACGQALEAGVRRGSRYLEPDSLLSLGRWSFLALHPAARARGTTNDLSAVLLGQALGRTVLLTGDIGSRVEERLARSWSQHRATVLKVAHHGSSSSTSASFLKAVQPGLALISAGRGNPYGHPAPEVLARLRGSGCQILRTDQHGILQVSWSQGSRIRIRFSEHQPRR